MATLATLQVSTDYGYVLLTAASSYILSIWLGVRIAPFRNAARVPHPHVAVSPEAIANAASPEEKKALYLFNCAQRAHYNFLENYPAALSSLLIGGLAYPRFAAAAGAAWILGRVMYAVGYTNTSLKNIEGKGRWSGGGFHITATSQIALLALVGKMGWDVLLGA